MTVLLRLLTRFLSTLWVVRLRSAAFLARQPIQMGRRNTLQVRVRAGGKGRLVIGDQNCFGFRPGPRLGSGEILVQARREGATVTLGSRNWFNNNVTLVANESIRIGDGCQIGDQVAIYDCDFHELSPATRNRSSGPTAPVVIGNNVWLGSRVMVLKGVTIGDNSVVGAMSLVTKSIPANSLAAGVPAKVIRALE